MNKCLVAPCCGRLKSYLTTIKISFLIVNCIHNLTLWINLSITKWDKLTILLLRRHARSYYTFRKRIRNGDGLFDTLHKMAVDKLNSTFRKLKPQSNPNYAYVLPQRMLLEHFIRHEFHIVSLHLKVLPLLNDFYDG